MFIFINKRVKFAYRYDQSNFKYLHFYVIYDAPFYHQRPLMLIEAFKRHNF